MEEILTGVGLITILGLFVLAIMLIIDCVKSLTEKLKLKYKQKHRFDKLPTARCYCVDCKYHNNETGECYRLSGWYTADCWYCWNAEPKEAEEVKENE